MPRSLPGRLLSVLPLLVLSLALLAPARRGERVRVMTFNIHHGVAEDGRLDLEGIARVIRAHRADVVGLQEVDRHWSERSGFADQAAELARRLHMHAYFAPLYELPPAEAGRPRRQYGLAILSRFPVTAARNHGLTRLPTVPGLAAGDTVLPGFPEVTLDVHGTPLHVLDTHLDYRGDPSVRAVQVREMLEILAGVEGPKVLVGDFNAPPDAAELRLLREALRDAWAEGGEGAGNTYPADAPVKRIDHIYLSPGVEVAEVSVPATTASDHRPVVAELLLTGDGG